MVFLRERLEPPRHNIRLLTQFESHGSKLTVSGEYYKKKMNPPKFRFGESAEVIVGEPGVKFTIYANIFRARSTFFRARLSEEWNANKTPIELTDIDPQHFDNYIACTYGPISVIDSRGEGHFSQMCNTYILADRFGDAAALNKLVDEIMRYSDAIQEVPSWETIKAQLGQLPTSSSLYRLVVDMYVHEAGLNIREAVLRGEKDETSQTFLAAIGEVFLQEVGVDYSKTLPEVFSTSASSRPKCYYHHHDDLCPKCKEEEGESMVGVDD